MLKPLLHFTDACSWLLMFFGDALKMSRHTGCAEISKLMMCMDACILTYVDDIVEVTNMMIYHVIVYIYIFAVLRMACKL